MTGWIGAAVILRVNISRAIFQLGGIVPLVLPVVSDGSHSARARQSHVVIVVGIIMIMIMIIVVVIVIASAITELLNGDGFSGDEYHARFGVAVAVGNDSYRALGSQRAPNPGDEGARGPGQK